MLSTGQDLETEIINFIMTSKRNLYVENLSSYKIILMLKKN